MIENINGKNQKEDSDDLKRKSPGIRANEYIIIGKDQNDMGIDSDE